MNGKDYMAVKWIETTGATVDRDFETIFKRDLTMYVESPVFGSHHHVTPFPRGTFINGYFIDVE